MSAGRREQHSDLQERILSPVALAGSTEGILTLRLRHCRSHNAGTHPCQGFLVLTTRSPVILVVSTSRKTILQISNFMTEISFMTSIDNVCLLFQGHSVCFHRFIVYDTLRLLANPHAAHVSGALYT